MSDAEFPLASQCGGIKTFEIDGHSESRNLAKHSGLAFRIVDKHAVGV